MSALSRRDFLRAAPRAALAPGLALVGCRYRLEAASTTGTEFLRLPARAITAPGDKKWHHFFGYYDKCPWDSTGRYVLAHRVAFAARQPTADEEVMIGMVDRQDNDRFVPLARTRAWCWQQGAMLQWLGSAADREILFNSLTDDEPTATILDVHTHKTRTLPRPIYALSADGRQAVTLDFARLHRLRPGYGYASYQECFADEPAPEKLGIWWMDMKTGKNELVVNLKQLAALQPDQRFRNAHHWVNHLQFNPSGTRFVFLHRWKQPGVNRWDTRMLTAQPDGRDVRITFDDGLVSHFDWKDDQTILAWARTRKDGVHFYEVDVPSGATKILGADVLTADGHCSYSPDRQWILNDTYPDKERMQTLMLYKVATGRRYNLNQFYSPKEYTGPVRCDLHPRWNRDGTAICFDGCHDPQRQLYVMDVRDVVTS